jgi:hypothetical protein
MDIPIPTLEPCELCDSMVRIIKKAIPNPMFRGIGDDSGADRFRDDPPAMLRLFYRR